MFCNSCGCKMDEHDRFCPRCGTRNEQPLTREYQQPAPTKEYVPQQNTQYAPVDSGYAAAAPEIDDDPQTTILDGGENAAYYRESYAEPINQDRRYQHEHGERMQSPPQTYQDSFIQQNEAQDPSRFSDSGWKDPSQSKRKPYTKTTPGRKAASILLCIMMLLFGATTLTIGTARLALSENNVRRAYQKGSLADLRVETEEGEKTFTQVFMENLVDARTGEPIPLDTLQVEAFLRSQNINSFAENLLVDFTGFFVFGKTPKLLNSTEITAFLTSISNEIRDKTGYSMSDADIRYFGQRIDGGDLSFLSIDENGDYFRQKYHFDPKSISVAFSLWVMLACAGLTLLCIVMIFVINHGNLPAGLSFVGSTMIIFGVLHVMVSAGLLVMTYIKPVFFLTDITRGVALISGGISLAVLVIGIILSAVKTVLRNRI